MQHDQGLSFHNSGTGRGSWEVKGKGHKETQRHEVWTPVYELRLGALVVKKGTIQKFQPDPWIEQYMPSPGLFFQRLAPVRIEPRFKDRYISELRARVFQTWIDRIWRNDQVKAMWNRYCSAYHQRFRAILDELKARGWGVQHGILETTARLVVGLGQTTFWEVGMTWHRPSGLPYIPASALKGITRNLVYAEIFGPRFEAYVTQHPPPVGDEERMKQWLKEANQFLEKEEIREKNSGNPKLQRMYRLFGQQERAGRAVFFEAFPADVPQFTVDVMNVHYPSYYQGTGEPDDTENPNPVTFLVIDQARFFIAIAVRPGLDRVEAVDVEDDANWLWGRLTRALAEHGVGSKTRLGYGRFHMLRE